MTKKRRQWSHEEKHRIAAEAFQPGADKKAVAEKYGVALSLIYRWEKELRAKGDPVKLGDPSPKWFRQLDKLKFDSQAYIDHLKAFVAKCDEEIDRIEGERQLAVNLAKFMGKEID